MVRAVAGGDGYVLWKRRHVPWKVASHIERRRRSQKSREQKAGVACDMNFISPTRPSVVRWPRSGPRRADHRPILPHSLDFFDRCITMMFAGRQRLVSCYSSCKTARRSSARWFASAEIKVVEEDNEDSSESIIESITELERNLRPSQVVRELDLHIVGQKDAKRAVAIAMRNRWRRKQLPEELRKEVTPRNVLLVGPTGCGKVRKIILSFTTFYQADINHILFSLDGSRPENGHVK